MSVSVTLPALGESVTEGTVTRWLKAEGERVEADEPLLEVSTDKVDTEIPAPAAGILAAIKVAEDETVEVGAELAIIDDGTGAPVAAAAPAAEPAAALTTQRDRGVLTVNPQVNRRIAGLCGPAR
ncbi:biotin/lipoyl-containing protein, partial [Streptomyces sp. NPDC005989]|uniref:biotin/lipoyl-containing protein n=1 Tax=Streptomyces sp. NPDC005989 TaxID=3156727 RepID=UPI0033DB200E